MAHLSPQTVEKMLANIAVKGASPRTVEHCRAVLRNALHHAMRHTLIGRNVAALADGPSVPAREVMALTPDGARRVLQAVSGDRLEALFTVALACGLRQSETLGLRWSDVNVDAATLSIQQGLTGPSPSSHQRILGPVEPSPCLRRLRQPYSST